MGQKFQVRSKTSKIPIKTRDILGPNIDTAKSSFSRFDLLRFLSTILVSFRRENLFEPHLYAHNRLATLLTGVN